jgi:SAM-dependent methyltransferase
LRPLRNLIRPFFSEGSGPEHWMRVVMNQETKRLIDSLNPGSLKVLEISGRYWDQPNLFREYPGVYFPEFDICSQTLAEKFDLIIAEQVFEHLLWPFRAAKNVHAMLRPGGYFLITTPFSVRIHNAPTDCSRWSEVGIKYFLADCGFPLEEIQTGSWGNRACVRAHLKDWWYIYQSWRHSLENEPDYPLSVWALARKSLDPGGVAPASRRID